MKLYKYISPEWICVLTDAQIKFSSSLSLNDPFELRPNITAVASDEDIIDGLDSLTVRLTIEEYAHSRTEMPLHDVLKAFNNHLPQIINNFPRLAQNELPKANSILQKILCKVGILSLSKNAGSLLMWAHYADGHRGYVIEFDSNSRFFDQRRGDTASYKCLQKVKYFDKRPSYILNKANSLDIISSKSLDWRYEQEYRMLLPLQDANKISGIGPSAIHLFDFPKRAVKSVFIGCMASDETRDQILNTINKDKEYKTVAVFQATIDEQNYRVSFSPIKR